MQKPGGDETKMSKSRGTAVWIRDYLDNGGNPDSLRYYLTMVAPERARAAFKPDDMVARHNGELANALGNFVHRILSFSRKNFGPNVPALVTEKLNDGDRSFIAARESCFREATDLLERHEFKAALERIMEFCRECNRYVDLAAPWTTKKTDQERTTTTLKICIDAIRFLAVVIEPFMPFTAENLAGVLNLSASERGWAMATSGLETGRAVNEPKILFAKIEDWRTLFPALAG
jgi:methionyl-tRNA synthetase